MQKWWNGNGWRGWRDESSGILCSKRRWQCVSKSPPNGEPLGANKSETTVGDGNLSISGVSRGFLGAGIDKGTVTRVISEGWFEVAYDHAAIEARVPRSRIHLPPGSSMGRGDAITGSTKGIICEGTRVLVSQYGLPISSVSTPKGEYEEKRKSSANGAGNHGGNDLHILSLVSTCPSTERPISRLLWVKPSGCGSN